MCPMIKHTQGGGEHYVNIMPKKRHKFGRQAC